MRIVLLMRETPSKLVGPSICMLLVCIMIIRNIHPYSTIGEGTITLCVNLCTVCLCSLRSNGIDDH